MLTARVEGRKGHLVYRCRIGHTYSLAELLAGKEEQIETRLWSALATQEELIDLLEDAVLTLERLAQAIIALAAGQALEAPRQPYADAPR